MLNNEVFTALSKEGQFAFEILHSGVTQLRKANYAKKGLYYQSFINLTVGIERIAKLCILLDYYIDSNGKFPNDKFVRKIGHDINKLYNKSIDIKEKYSLKFKYLNTLNEIHFNILDILSNFATKDRYENINILVNAKQENNPIGQWFENVDMLLFNKHISKKKKAKIINNAKTIDYFASPFTLVRHSSEDDSEINQVYEASLRTGIYTAICPYRQLYTIQIIRFWTELLWALQYKAQSLGNDDIPFFSDMFGCFYNDDSYLRTRKNYETC